MICSGCFREIRQSQICPLCGYNLKVDSERRRAKKALPPMYRLAGKYSVGKMLGAGGFGITYLGKDEIDGKLVAIKEFFPAEICDRGADGRVIPRRSEEAFRRSVQHFFEEAKTLYTLGSCPSVARVYGFFRGNNTSYIVMEFVQGNSLKQYVENQGGRLPYTQAKSIIVQIALALSEVHSRGIVHSDVSPSNILMQPNGDVKLVDFGASRNFLNKSNVQLTVQVKPGFTPPEQYTGSTLKLGPWTDVYALACTFYKIVTGRMPPPATDRKVGEEVVPLAVFEPNVEPYVVHAISRAMELEYTKRYQTIDAFISDFTDYNEREKKTDLNSAEQTVDAEEARGLIRKFGQSLKAKYDAFSSKNAANDNAYVEIVKGLQPGKRLMLEPERMYLIGRQQDMCDMVVSNNSVISRVHCAVKYSKANESVVIFDKSSNGVVLSDGKSLYGGSKGFYKSSTVALANGEVILNIIIKNSRGG
jgi:serine/threonine protein kinase